MAWKLKGIKYLKQERGSILVLVVLLLPIMFGCLGFAYDFGNLYMHRTRLQNVADAAALAGARAYLDSQTTDKPDGIDGTIYSKNKVMGGDGTTIYDEKSRQEYTYVPTSNPNPPSITHGDSKHSKADNAADAYIYKNIINLGNNVKSDIWSHYALDSSGGENAKTFYRIGLSEEVRLYFLPIIKNVPKTQTVRVGAIALVEKGTTTVTGGSVTLNPTSTFSIFDNLFTYSDTFHTRHTDHDNGDVNDHVITSFVGDMVYTHGSNNYSYFYTLQDHNLTHHYYTSLGGYSGNSINDTVINTVFDITAYVEAFQKKLLEPHVDIHDQIFNLTGNGQINDACQYLMGTTKLRKVGDIYYPLDENGNHLTLTVNGETYDICYRIMPPGEWNSPFILCAKQRTVTKTTENGTFQGGQGVKTQTTLKYYLLNSNNQITNCFIEEISYIIQYEYWTTQPQIETNAYVEKNNVKYQLKYNNGTFVYGDSNLPVSSILEPNVALATPIEKSSFQVEQHSGGSSNIFHYGRSLQGAIQNLEITINNDSMTGDTPIYVIVDSDVDLVKITGSASNNRPLILVYLGSGNIQFTSYTGQHFKGTIYAPYATIAPLNLNSGGGGQKFSGSIIVKNLDVEGTLDNTIFERVNYLNDDIEVKAVSDKIKEDMSYANSQLTDTYLQQLADSFNGLSYSEGENGPTHTLTVTKDNLADKNWYDNLSYWEKQGLYGRWKTLYETETDPNKKNLLWLWSSMFTKSEESGSSETTADTLRLINFRTDFQEKNSDGTVNNGEKDPFIYLSLDGKSY